MSAERGHHYANPTNHFWPCLHLSGAYIVVALSYMPSLSTDGWQIIGFTPRLLLASEDSTLPEKYNLGLVSLHLDTIRAFCPSGLRLPLFLDEPYPASIGLGS